MVEIARVVECTIRVIKMKKPLIYYKEVNILCIGGRVVVDRVV